MLEIEALSHVYPNGTRALDRVSLSIDRGLFGLLGPNGAGKSSLMRIVATLQQPSAGKVTFDRVDVLADARRLRRRLGYLPQDFGVYPGVSAASLFDQIAVLKGITEHAQRHATAERLLKLVNLWQVRDRAVSSLSGGMRQRWGVAQALIGEPDLLILDEPTAGLDPAERNRFHELLFDLGQRAVVIVSTHSVEDVADLCSGVAVLAGGRLLAQGQPSALAAALNGSVWQGPAEPAGQRGMLLSRRLLNGQRISRVLAAQQPAPNFVPVRATLQDAYFAALGRVAAPSA